MRMPRNVAYQVTGQAFLNMKIYDIMKERMGRGELEPIWRKRFCCRGLISQGARGAEHDEQNHRKSAII